MRITLEPTNKEEQRKWISIGDADCIHSKVSIEHPMDEMVIDQLFDNLIKPALLAYGFAEESINNLFKDE